MDEGKLRGRLIMKRLHMGGVSTLSCFKRHGICLQAWMREDWRKASGGTVRNRRIFLLLWVACKQMDSVVWRHVPGHSGHLGNENAHLLAERGSQLALKKLQQGELPKICVENDEQLEEDFVSDDYVDDDTLLDLLSSDLLKR